MFRRSLRLLHSAECLNHFHKIKLCRNTTKVLFSTYDKDLPNPSLPTPLSKVYSHDTDILLEQIRRTQSIERLLELTTMHLNVMNAKHLVESMKVIHDLSKNLNFKREDLIENEIFQGLCSRLMKTIRLLDAQEVITSYKTLSSLGIRNNTFVMQALLKMVGSHLNNMTLGQLTFLHFVLSKQRPNSLIDGLKLALPLVLQVQIEQQLDSDNINEIVNCFQLACKSRLKPAIIEKVLAVILEKAKVLSPSNVLTVLFALLNLDTPIDGYKELKNYCFEVLSKSLESLSQKQILSILRLCRNRGLYDSRFLFAAADKVVSEKWNFEQIYETVNYFNFLNFAPTHFLDYFVDTICLEKDNLKRLSFFSPLNCAEYLSLTGYRPSKLEEALAVLCSCENKLSEMTQKSAYLLSKYITCIAILGYFPKEYLEKVLTENFLFDSWSSCKKQGRSNDFEISMLSLVWSFQRYDQLEHFKFPSAVLKKLVSIKCQKLEGVSSPLENFIHHGLGGPQFLQSGLFTNDGIFIDHVLAFRSGNYPVSFQVSNQSVSHTETSNKTVFVEDLILPEDAKIVAVIVAKEDMYCRDPEVLKGWMDLKVRCLLKRKYYPVVINYSTFKDMPDREKIPFLMREIKLATEENSLVKTSFLS